MKAIAYKSGQFENSFIVTILAEDGYLITKFECYSYKKAPEIAQKLCPGHYVEWVANPWGNEINKNQIKAAQTLYEEKYLCEFNGRV